MSLALKNTVRMLGGTLAVSRSFKVTPQTVSSWIKRGNIPSKYWPALLALARNKGISLSLERLIGIESEPDEESQLAATA
jgi:hypothetical protein